jgi:hypothetical protein
MITTIVSILTTQKNMKPPLSLLVLLVTSTAIAQEPSASPSPSPLPQMFVSDGQILNAPIKVFVSFANIDRNMKPRLQLAPFQAQSRTNINLKEWEPFVIAANQTWTEKVAGQDVERSGTLLMFDLNQFSVDWWKSSTRVTPVLTWQSTDPANPKPMLVGQSLYLGKGLVAGAWTFLVVVALIVLIIVIARVKKPVKTEEDTKEKTIKNAVYLLCGPDNYMSLWRTQLAVWTIAVGSMVFLFGIIQLQVPRIPESLVALMGLSVATGGLSNLTDTKRTKNHKIKPRFFHLLTSYSEEAADKVVLSVSKAQMVFWTGVILVLFILKSLSSGELWDVPWELVALTGVSQAGYVTDKAVERQKEQNATKNLH